MLAPLPARARGEPCSRLEEPLTRYRVDLVVHGHAHRGVPEGRTANGVPVYNVALQVLQRDFPDRPAFKLLEVHTDGG